MRRSTSDRLRIEDSPSKRTRLQDFQRNMAEQRIQDLEAQLQQAQTTLQNQGLQIAAIGQQRQPQQQAQAAPAQYNPGQLNMNNLMAAANIQVCNPKLTYAARCKLFDATQFATNATEHDQANNPFVKHKLAEALGETSVSRAYGAYLDQAFKCTTLGLPLPAAPPAQAPSNRSSSRRKPKPNQRKQ